MDRIEFFKTFPLLPPQSLDPLNGALERSAKHTSKFYSRLIDDCEQHVGWENVDSFDKETQMLTLWL
ncbi:hypothetical protein GGI11_003194 [Coemansia sp. RSA 2049]|nr:hypothetical protein GGI11_003194 [Coemansia sp. RSA 2049]